MRTGIEYKIRVEYTSNVSCTHGGDGFCTLEDAIKAADRTIESEGKKIKQIEIFKLDWDNRRGSCATSETVKTYKLNFKKKPKRYVCVAYSNKNTGLREPIHLGPSNAWIQEKFLIEADNEMHACQEIDKYKKEHGNPDWSYVNAFHAVSNDNRYYWDSVAATKHYTY